METHVDKKRGEYQHCCEVDGDDRLEEKCFEVIGGVADHVEKDSGDECGEDNSEKSAAQCDLNLQTGVLIFFDNRVGVNDILVHLCKTFFYFVN